MGQLIVCATTQGIVAGSDSKVEFFEPDGTIRFIIQDHLTPIGSRVILASAGAWVSQDICREFAEFARSENLTDLEDLIKAAIPFFTAKYDEIMRLICRVLPPDPVVNMYLVLAGYSPKTPDQPFQLFVIWDRPKPPKIEYTQATHIFTLPRRMGLEYTLNSLVAQNAPLAQVVEAVKQGMEKLAAKDDRIGPPYKYMTVTAEGIYTV